MAVALVSPRSAAPMAAKYAALPAIVARMEPSDIGYVFKNAQQPHAFLPSMGLFAVEFALGYCHNLHYRRANGTAQAPAAVPDGHASASGLVASGLVASGLSRGVPHVAESVASAAAVMYGRDGAGGTSSVGRGRGRGPRKL